MHFSSLLVAAACLIGITGAIETIIVKNRHLYTNSTQKPFFVRGVDYQPGGSANFKSGKDPLSDINTCARDIYLFQQLGINVIRVYSVDPEISHDECMTLLAMAGIYVVLDVNTPLPNQHLNNQEPWTTYNPVYLEHIFKVVEHFAGYANTLGFLAGNEVIFDSGSAKASPNYQKAVVRDLKAYITNHVSRIIPIGYSNADDLRYRVSLATYLQCGEVGYIDFWGVNSYQWCGASTFQGSGYDTLVADYANYSLPVFFTEYGCNKVLPRKWQEVGALYSTQMTGVMSGGLVYEYSQESNNYGLVDISDDGNASTRQDFETLLAAYKNIPDNDVKFPSQMTTPTRPMTCPPSSDPVFDKINANMTLPTSLGTDMIQNGVKVTRGKFLTSVKMTTTYSIEVAGKTVSKPAVVSNYPANNPPLAPGGIGINIGGGIGKGAPQSGGVEGTVSPDKKAAATAIGGNRGLVFAASMCAVALGFGLFL